MLEKWNEYYSHFNQPETYVRDGCHPLIFKHGDRARNAVVLVHGLSDPPYCIHDIGEYFCAEMGFDVYSPVLQAHRLKDSQGMKDASAEACKADVRFAVKEAKKSAGKVSILVVLHLHLLLYNYKLRSPVACLD
jgi:alpha-beta hydrolase superfamily lysophospholipase